MAIITTKTITVTEIYWAELSNCLDVHIDETLPYISEMGNTTRVCALQDLADIARLACGLRMTNDWKTSAYLYWELDTSVRDTINEIFEASAPGITQYMY